MQGNDMLRIFATAAASLMAVSAIAHPVDRVAFGPRPFYLIDRMAEGPLKD